MVMFVCKWVLSHFAYVQILQMHWNPIYLFAWIISKLNERRKAKNFFLVYLNIIGNPVYHWWLNAQENSSIPTASTMRAITVVIVQGHCVTQLMSLTYHTQTDLSETNIWQILEEVLVISYSTYLFQTLISYHPTAKSMICSCILLTARSLKERNINFHRIPITHFRKDFKTQGLNKVILQVIGNYTNYHWSLDPRWHANNHSCIWSIRKLWLI